VKLRKILAILITVLLLSTLMMACSNAPETPAPAPSDAPGGEASADAGEAGASGDLERVTIEWYIVGDTPTDADAVNAYVTELLNSRHNLNVDFHLRFFGWGDFDDRMSINFQTGEPMDIVFSSSWGAFNHFPPLAAAGALTPLNDLLDMYGQDILAQIGDRGILEAHTFRGNIYGVPVLGDHIQRKGLTFRADLADAHGFDYQSVKTLADVEPFLQQMILDNEPGAIPMHIEPSSAMDDYSAGAGTFEDINLVARYIYETGEIIFRWDSPETIELMHMMRDWYQKGFLPLDIASRTEVHAESASGNFAVLTNSSFMNDGLRTTELWGYRTYDVEIEFPKFLTTPAMAGVNAVIPASSRNPERAMMVMNAVWGDAEIFNVLTFGLQGTHWDFNDSNEVVFGGDFGNAGWGGPYHWMIANAYNRHPTTTESAELWAAMEERFRTAARSPILGFTYDSSGLRTENAQLEAIITEYTPILYTGSSDIDSTLADVRGRLERAGLEDVLEDSRRQLAEWKASR